MKHEHFKSVKRTIILYSTKKFIKEGIKITSIDTIARELHISKKTIYKYFKSKDELVYQIVNDILELSNKETMIISKSKLDSYNKFIRIINYVTYGYIKYQKYFIPDLRVKYPQIYNEIFIPHQNNVESLIVRIIKRCQRERLIVKLSPEVYMKSYFLILQSFISNKFKDSLLRDFDVINTTMYIFINGLFNVNHKSKFHKLSIKDI